MRRILYFALVTTLLAGCAKLKQNKRFSGHVFRSTTSIVVVPAINMSTAADAEITERDNYSAL